MKNLNIFLSVTILSLVLAGCGGGGGGSSTPTPTPTPDPTDPVVDKTKEKIDGDLSVLLGLSSCSYEPKDGEENSLTVSTAAAINSNNINPDNMAYLMCSGSLSPALFNLQNLVDNKSLVVEEIDGEDRLVMDVPFTYDNSTETINSIKLVIMNDGIRDNAFNELKAIVSYTDNATGSTGTFDLINKFVLDVNVEPYALKVDNCQVTDVSNADVTSLLNFNVDANNPKVEQWFNAQSFEVLGSTSSASLPDELAVYREILLTSGCNGFGRMPFIYTSKSYDGDREPLSGDTFSRTLESYIYTSADTGQEIKVSELTLSWEISGAGTAVNIELTSKAVATVGDENAPIGLNHRFTN
jgi:hypothetical protein